MFSNIPGKRHPSHAGDYAATKVVCTRSLPGARRLASVFGTINATFQVVSGTVLVWGRGVRTGREEVVQQVFSAIVYLLSRTRLFPTIDNSCFLFLF